MPVGSQNLVVKIKLLWCQRGHIIKPIGVSGGKVSIALNATLTVATVAVQRCY